MLAETPGAVSHSSLMLRIALTIACAPLVIAGCDIFPDSPPTKLEGADAPVDDVGSADASDALDAPDQDVLAEVGPASCNNREKDGTESDIDCGGDVCHRCPKNKTCNLDSDCVSGECDDVNSRCN